MMQTDQELAEIRNLFTPRGPHDWRTDRLRDPETKEPLTTIEGIGESLTLSLQWLDRPASHDGELQAHAAYRAHRTEIKH